MAMPSNPTENPNWVNPATGQEYQWNPIIEAWDLVVASSEAAPQMVFYGVKPPDEAPVGAIFTDENTIKSFVHQGDGVWVEHTSCVGDGDGVPSTGLTGVKFTGYRVRSYVAHLGAPTILSEIYWETQTGIHFEDEIVVEVDMDNDGNWQDVHQMDDATKSAYDILNVFSPASGAVQFVYDWNNTHDGPWNPHPNFPCAQLRVTITNKNLENANDFTTETSEPMFVFPEYKQDPKEETPTPAHPGASC